MATAVAPSSVAPQKPASELRQQMRVIRRDLGQNVGDIVENAEQLMGWRYYVRRHPWATVVGATLIGYFLVPNGSPKLLVDDNTLARLAAKFPVNAQPSARSTKPGLIGSLRTMGTNLAVRTALGFISQEVGTFVGQSAANAERRGAHDGQSSHRSSDVRAHQDVTRERKAAVGLHQCAGRY